MALSTMPIMAIGDRIRELRLARKLTQEQVARAADLGGSHLAKIEQGGIVDPSWSTVCAIAKALGVPVTELQDNEPPPPPAAKKRK